MNSIAPSVIDQMTQIYAFVDDYLKAHPAQAAWRRSNNNAPAFTDAEVITLGLLQGAFGCATHKKTYQLVAANWRSAFPHLGYWDGLPVQKGAGLSAYPNRSASLTSNLGEPEKKIVPIPVLRGVRPGGCCPGAVGACLWCSGAAARDASPAAHAAGPVRLQCCPPAARVNG